jgi:predicted Zn-ribbon and HTH transcriptional regulator
MMTREDIIRMLREAWISEAEAEMLESDWTHLSQVFYEDLEKFANIVAAAEREAMVIDAAKRGWVMKNEDPFEDAMREIAVIRARGQNVTD